MGPDYAAPEINAPDSFVSQNVFDQLSSVENTSLPPLDDSLQNNWWDGFNDPMLSELVDDALHHNYAIASAAARLSQAHAQLNLAKSGDKIRMEAGVDSGADERFEFGNGGDSTTSGDLFGSLSFVWPVDAFGRTYREVEAARARVEASSAAYRSVILTVSSNITSEYLLLRGNQKQLALLIESVELQKQTLAIVDSRFKAGLAPELDLRRAEAAVANLEADIPPLREALINSQNSISVLTGQFPGTHTETLVIEKDIPTYNRSIPTLMPMEVLQMRPDVQQAEANLKNAIAAIGAAKADYYPIVQLSKQISLGASGASSDPTVGILFAGIRALIRQVITDGGERDAVFDTASARADEALSNYRQTLLLAVEDVERSLTSLQSSLNRQQSLDQAVNASSRSFFQAESLYKQGLTSFLDVVDAQRVLASAQQQLASARTAYAVEVANLFRVLGTTVHVQ
jgi:NodT family efflux transporter outer membrane factor (OMF) lipoprotein